MKTIITKMLLILTIISSFIFIVPRNLFSQEISKQILDQNISIYAEDEPLSDIIKKLCDYLGIDYSYNLTLVEGKRVNLNISNKPIKYILEKLMKDFYLLFEIENNIMVVRNYVPLEESITFDKTTNHYQSSNRGFLFDNPRKKSVSIKFKSVSNLIIIPVTINESDTLNFILDTGVRYPIITELPFINKLNLNYMTPVDIYGLGEGSELIAYRSGNNTIKLNGLTAWDQEIQMIIDENFQISHILGLPVHGLIGFNLFKDYIVKIDYSKERITLFHPEDYKYRKRRKNIILPIYIEGNKPFIHTNIVTEDSIKVPVKLLVDTGASDALWLSEKSDDRINIPHQHIETFLGQGLIGDLYGTRGRIKALWIGSLILTNPIVAFPDSELIEQLISSNDRNGTIGGEVLRRFDVIIDYKNSRLTLHPTNRIKDEFNYNMSGMEITNPMPGFPIFIIKNIQKNSPAFHAGLQENDQILSINNSNHKTLKLNDINLLLQSKEKRKIKIKVLRNGEEYETSFILKKLF